MFITSLAAGTLAVLLTQTPAPSPQDPQPPPSTSSTPSPTVAAWRAELDAARRAKSHGRALQVAGAGTLFTGMVLVRAAFAGPRGSVGRFYAGQTMELGGAGLLSVGRTRVRDATTTIRWLETHGPAPLSRVVWQAERDAALQKRAHGRLVEYAIGLPIAVAGVAVTVSARHCDSDGCGFDRTMGGFFTTLAGAAVSDVGWRIAHDAGVTLKLLKTHPPGTIAPASSVTVAVQPRIGLSRNRTAALFCRVTW